MKLTFDEYANSKCAIIYGDAILLLSYDLKGINISLKKVFNITSVEESEDAIIEQLLIDTNNINCAL